MAIRDYEIKICGIKTEAEIETINGYPVDYIGFIFATSKRQITVEQGAVLRSKIKPGIKVVGVFVDPTYEDLLLTIKLCGLDIVQLHGSEPNELIQKITIPVWKSIPIRDANSLEALESYPDCAGFLLDTYHKGATGGTGEVFNWNLIKDLNCEKPIILAGGLSTQNIVEAIRTVRPQVVDLNSGLETNLIKDPVKVKALFEVLEEHEEALAYE
jgi:phosphoribosylanthranilate isomerase